MIAGVCILALYVVGGAVTWRAASRAWTSEFGVDREFMDFYGRVFVSACSALVWPIVAVAYGAWRLRDEVPS